MRKFLQFAFASALLGAFGCGIESRSGEFACQVESDCSVDRTCEQGFCVYRPGFIPDAAVDAALVGDAALNSDAAPNSDAPNSDAALNVDAAPGVPDGGNPVDAMPADAKSCDPLCSSCEGTTCIIACTGQASCSSVVCPAGWDCRVDCSGQGSCASVDCGAATGCTVNCSGLGSCLDQVQCNTSACAVNCTATDSCAGGVDCDQACKCDTTCPVGGCGAMLCLPPGACNSGGQCRSAAGPCNTCL